MSARRRSSARSDPPLHGHRGPAAGRNALRLALLLVCAAAVVVAAVGTPSCTLDRLGTSLGPDGAAPDAGFECDRPEDCPGLDEACQRRDCADHVCGFYLEPAGAPCTEDDGNFCDGQGACVECVEDAHCTPELCRDGRCIPAACLDGQLNGDESDLDCGGSCLPCANGQRCNGADDCQSGYCSNAGVCAPCSIHEDCPDGYCDAATGQCADRKDDGDVCAEGAECVSDNCPSPDFVCCNAVCDLPCVACMQGWTGQPNGVCAVVSAQTDPQGECAADPPCGSTGVGCDGQGGSPGCVLQGSGDPCGDALSCSSGVQTNQDTCNGSGSCIDNGTKDCEGLICNGAVCRTSCSDHSHCLLAYWCEGGSKCQADKAHGQPCGSDQECVDNEDCEDSFCCDMQCDGPCLNCSDKPGACTGNSCSCAQQYDTANGYVECSASSTACEFFINYGSTDVRCFNVCRNRGGECLDAWNDGAGGGWPCSYGSNDGCSTQLSTQICRCSRGCGAGHHCPPGQTCSSGTCG